jgi:hypothetical protein
MILHLVEMKTTFENRIMQFSSNYRKTQQCKEKNEKEKIKEANDTKMVKKTGKRKIRTRGDEFFFRVANEL